MDTTILIVGLADVVLIAAAFAIGWRLARRSQADGRARPSDERVIFDASPAMIWFKDKQNRILRINHAAAAAVGVAPALLEGRPTAEIYPEEADKYYKDDLEVMVSGVPKIGIVEQLASGGGKRWVRTDKIPYRGFAGNIAGVIVFALDITDQKKIETQLKLTLQEAERANRAKSEFLAKVSHEIRTPLGVMMGFAELLGSTDIELEKRHTFTEKILRNGVRLQRLIDELLDLSRIERGQMNIEMSSFRLHDLLADVTSMMAQQAREKGVTFVAKVSPTVPDRVVSDPLRLRQILFNVIGNAIKFTERGTVAVDAAPNEDRPELLTIIVRDSGKGIDPAKAGGLFQPFFQTDAENARRYGGSGLGLALSRRLARSLGGDVELVESQPGLGSTFRITIQVAPQSPHVRPHEAESQAASPTPMMRLGVSKKTRILIAEDNLDIQEMVRHYLRLEDVSMTVVGNGRLAVDQALADVPDLVLMDLQLPELNGLDAVRELRARGFTAPIIALTAHAMSDQRDACLGAGFTDFLAKPVSRDDLIANIRGTLAMARGPSHP